MSSPPPPRPAGSNHVQISIRSDPSSPAGSPSIKQGSWGVRPSTPLISLNPRHPSTTPATTTTPEQSAARVVSTEPKDEPERGREQRGRGDESWLAGSWSEIGDTRRRTGSSPTPPSGGLSRRGTFLQSVPGAGWSTARVVDLAVKSLGTLWVVEPEQLHPSNESRHRDDDIPLPTSPRPSFATSSSRSLARLRASFNHPKDLLQLSRAGYLVVLCLLLLGLAELVSYSSHPSSSSKPPPTSPTRIRIKNRDPFDVLAQLSPPRAHPSGALVAQDRLWKTGYGTSAEKVLLENDGNTGDVTAIVLHWKRTDNVVLIVASLCQYSFFNTILVWNNNPEVHLTRKNFAASACPGSKLRIYNSPRNMLFYARYLACASSATPHCFFQDDDWLVRPLRALYSQFSRDPEGPVVVHTNSEVATLYSLEWCFFQPPLHTCFSWVGTGAFVAKSHVVHFLSTISSTAPEAGGGGPGPYGREELGHADNSFTLFQNEPPYVLSSALTQLPAPFGHSDGDGLARNKRYIQQGLVHLTAYLSLTSGVDLSLTSFSLPTSPLPISTTSYLTPSLPPLPPHPYTHHARSPSVDDSCVFLTNIPLLPPPDAAPYPGPHKVSLEGWENHLGWYARGWKEGTEMFGEEESWALDWPYAAAVDGRSQTAFRSPDVMRPGDYIGLGLLAAVDPQWVPRLTLHFVLEHVKDISELLSAEVSLDGYRWQDPQISPSTSKPPAPICRTTSHTSTLPDLSFPNSYLVSPAAKAIRMAEQALEESSLLGTWWRRRRRRSVRLLECAVVLETAVGSAGVVGWRFVRLKVAEGAKAGVGWGVYQMWVE